MTMREDLEFAVPMWSCDFIAFVVMGTIVVMATLLAVVELLIQAAIVFPCIWLAFIAWSTWSTCKQQGGPNKCIINFLGLLAYKQFVQCVSQNIASVEVRFGYQLFGYRFFYLKVPLEKIEKVHWGPGQAAGSGTFAFGSTTPRRGQSRKAP